MNQFPVQGNPSRHTERAQAVRAIAILTTDHTVFPAPIAALLIDEITWRLDHASPLADRSRLTDLVDAVLTMADTTQRKAS